MGMLSTRLVVALEPRAETRRPRLDVEVRAHRIGETVTHRAMHEASPAIWPIEV